MYAAALQRLALAASLLGPQVIPQGWPQLPAAPSAGLARLSGRVISVADW
jgi:hypothetical protein